jgi:hypothetical protein
MHHKNKAGDKQKATKPVLGAEGEGTEPDRVFRKEPQQQSDNPSWQHLESERMERIQRAIESQRRARLALGPMVLGALVP